MAASSSPSAVAPAKVIIDTDPGIDDINALLLALASPATELEILAITPTYGNVDIKNCTRNVVSLFHIIEREQEWRRSQGLNPGFEMLQRHQPIVAIGPSEPLTEQTRMADYFHGTDGLGGIYETHPHLSPKETWQHLFEGPPDESLISAAARQTTHTSTPDARLFRPSNQRASTVILKLLADHPPSTISIIAVGPLTNIALCAAEDPATLCRAKELVVMGGALAIPGNMTPLAEFNIYADAFAAARVFALSGPIPASTNPPMPPVPADDSEHSKRLRSLSSQSSTQPLGDRRLNIVLFPLDCTHQHELHKKVYSERISSLLAKGSPLAEWHSAFMAHAFRKMETLHADSDTKGVSVVLHDAICIWYVLEANRSGLAPSKKTRQVQEAPSDDWQFNPNAKTWQLSSPTDIRVESAGQWSRGACIVDRRDKRMYSELQIDAEALKDETGDEGGWLSDKRGNRIRVCTGTPGKKAFEDILLQRIFGL